MASSARIANKLPLEMLYHWERQCPDRIYLRQTIHREYVDFTWGEVADEARRMVTALRALGLAPGDKVALLSKNCAQWFIADLAMQMGGYVSVPIYPTANVDTIEYVLRHSEARAIFVGKLDDWKSQEAGVPGDLLRIALPYDTMPAAHQWDDLLAQYDPIPDSPVQAPDALLSLVYTSGSTGKPKGAMLSVERYAWSCEKLVEAVSLTAEDRGFSYLPLAHITERVYIYGGSLFSGATIAFPESLDTFIEDVKRCRPTVFISVPLLWAMFRIKIHEKLPQKKLDLLLKIPFISGLVKGKLQKGLGLDQARVLGCELPREAWKLRGRIGFLGHEPLLYRELSGRENLRFHARLHGLAGAAAEERIAALLEAVGMGHRAEDRVGELSAGMRQRLAICRCVLHEPELLLLDEPDSNLDEGGREVAQGLIGPGGGHTRVLVTHNAERFGPEADQVLRLGISEVAVAR